MLVSLIKGEIIVLGRKNFTQEEIDNGKATVNEMLERYKKLSEAFASGTSDKKLKTAQAHFEGQFFNNLTLVLDRFYVHRLRMVSGKDGNPLNEVELICESLMNNKGVFRGNNVIKYFPDQSVVGLKFGDKIRLTSEEFYNLKEAFFTDLERKYLLS